MRYERWWSLPAGRGSGGICFDASTEVLLVVEATKYAERGQLARSGIY